MISKTRLAHRTLDKITRITPTRLRVWCMLPSGRGDYRNTQFWLGLVGRALPTELGQRG